MPIVTIPTATGPSRAGQNIFGARRPQAEPARQPLPAVVLSPERQGIQPGAMLMAPPPAMVMPPASAMFMPANCSPRSSRQTCSCTHGCNCGCQQMPAQAMPGAQATPPMYGGGSPYASRYQQVPMAQSPGHWGGSPWPPSITINVQSGNRSSNDYLDNHPDASQRTLTSTNMTPHQGMPQGMPVLLSPGMPQGPEMGTEVTMPVVVPSQVTPTAEAPRSGIMPLGPLKVPRRYYREFP